MKSLTSFLSDNRYTALVIALLLVHTSNMFIDVMDIDAAQYALIAKEMFLNHSYLEVLHRGRDYLDKPPLLFWTGTLSFSLIGVSTFAYKLLPVLSLFFGAYATYRFARLWYPQPTARTAALILLSSQAYFLMTNDVRTDGLLTASVIGAVWMLTEFLQAGTSRHLLLGAVFTGLAMLSKGPVGLVAVGAAIGSDLILKKQYRSLLQPHWIVYLVVVGVMLLPMCYGLYRQYDLHPEKYIYDLKGPSGLAFFFWTQSVGRFTGEISLNNGATFFYFFHTILWDFLPWTIVLVGALLTAAGHGRVPGVRSTKRPEYASLGGFVFMFFLLSWSRYKLPHYVFITFPFASVLVADYLARMSDTMLSIFARIQFAVIHLACVALALAFILFFPPRTVLLPTVGIVLFGLMWHAFFTQEGVDKVVVPTVLLAITLNMVLSLHVYPSVMAYQAGSNAGRWIADRGDRDVYSYRVQSNAFDFYVPHMSKELHVGDLGTLPSGSYIYASAEGAADLLTRSDQVVAVKEFPSYRVTLLSLPFLMKSTREAQLGKAYVLMRR